MRFLLTEHTGIDVSEDGKRLRARVTVRGKMHSKIVYIADFTCDEHAAVVYLNRWMGCVRHADKRFHSNYSTPRKYRSQYLLWRNEGAQVQVAQ